MYSRPSQEAFRLLTQNLQGRIPRCPPGKSREPTDLNGTELLIFGDTAPPAPLPHMKPVTQPPSLEMGDEGFEIG
jgi:hypothetical protein